jgi:hypothetical protein
MANTARSSGFAQKSESDGFIGKITRANNLESSEPSQIDIKSLIGNPHRAPT